MDKYTFIEILATGSYGSAHLAVNRRTSSKCVIKEINVSHLKETELANARKEVKVLSSLEHNHITRFHDSFENDRCIFIVMEYCSGGDMKTLIDKRKGIHFPEDRVLDWFAQLSLAVKFIHDQHIIHRDIKTQNILLTETGRIKLGDFGIAKTLDTTADLAETFIGTPYYISPEICENRPYNNKSDIWAMGCVLYELLALKHAFSARNMKTLLLKIIKCSYDPVPSRYSRELKALIAAIFQRDSTARPSINTIIKKPFVRKRVSRFLTEKDSDDLLSSLKSIKRHSSSNMRRTSVGHRMGLSSPKCKYGCSSRRASARYVPSSFSRSRNQSASSLSKKPVQNGLNKPSNMPRNRLDSEKNSDSGTKTNFRTVFHKKGKPVIKMKRSPEVARPSRIPCQDNFDLSISNSILKNMGGVNLDVQKPYRREVEKAIENIKNAKRYSLHDVQFQNPNQPFTSVARRARSLDPKLQAETIHRKVSMLVQKEMRRISESAQSLRESTYSSLYYPLESDRTITNAESRRSVLSPSDVHLDMGDTPRQTPARYCSYVKEPYVNYSFASDVKPLRLSQFDSTNQSSCWEASQKRKQWDVESRDIVSFLSNATLTGSMRGSCANLAESTLCSPQTPREVNSLQRSMSEPLGSNWGTKYGKNTFSSVAKSVSTMNVGPQISISTSKLFNVTYTKKSQMNNIGIVNLDAKTEDTKKFGGNRTSTVSLHPENISEKKIHKKFFNFWKKKPQVAKNVKFSAEPEPIKKKSKLSNLLKKFGKQTEPKFDSIMNELNNAIDLSTKPKTPLLEYSKNQLRNGAEKNNEITNGNFSIPQYDISKINEKNEIASDSVFQTPYTNKVGGSPISMTSATTVDSDLVESTAFNIVENVFKSALKKLEDDRMMASNNTFSKRRKYMHSNSVSKLDAKIIKKQNGFVTNLERLPSPNSAYTLNLSKLPPVIDLPTSKFGTEQIAKSFITDTVSSATSRSDPMSEKLRCYSVSCEASPLILTPFKRFNLDLKYNELKRTLSDSLIHAKVTPVSEESLELASFRQSLEDLLSTNEGCTATLLDESVFLSNEDVYGWIEEHRQMLEDSLGVDIFIKNYHILREAFDEDSSSISRVMEEIQQNLNNNKRAAENILELIVRESVYEN